MLLRQAKELFKNQKYATAQKHFKEFLQYPDFASKEKPEELKAEAEFYHALCALELGNNNTEKLLLDFMNNYPAHFLAERAQFHLGSFHFQKKQFKATEEILEDVDISALTNDEVIEFYFKRGYSRFYEKKFDGAKQDFSQIKDLNSEYYLPSNYYYGYIEYYNQDYEAALGSFERIAESKMYKKVVPFYILQINYIQKNYIKVIQSEYVIDDLHRVYQPQANKLVGLAHFQRKDYEKAIPFIKTYVNTAPKVMAADLYNLGFAHYKQGDYQKAANNFRRLGAKDDSLAQNATYLLADCYLHLNEKSRAKSAYQKASQMNYNPKIQEVSTFNYGKLSYDLRSHSEAANTLQGFLEDYPNSKYANEAKEILTDFFLTTKDYKKALDVVESITEKNPNIKAAYQKVAYYHGVEVFNTQSLNERTRFSRAIKLFDKSLQNPIDPGITANCYYWKGEAYYNLKGYDNAIQEFNKFKSIINTYDTLPMKDSEGIASYNIGYSYYKKGTLYASRGKAQAGDRSYNSALIHFKNSLKEMNASPEIFTKVPVYEKVYPDALMRTADCQYILKNYDQAIASYNKIIENNYPGTDYALYQKGLIQGLGARPKYQERVETLQHLTEKYPNSLYDAASLFLLGKTYFNNLDNKQTAATYFKRVLEEHPETDYAKESYSQLGLIYANLEDYDQSIHYYRQLADKYPNTQYKQQAINAIKDLLVEKKDENIPQTIKSWFGEGILTVSEKDDLMYRSAEKIYHEGNYEKAIKQYNAYLDSFPKGMHSFSAHFFRSQSYYSLNNYKQALPDLEYVLNARQGGQYTEIAAYQAAYIYYDVTKDYQKAYNTFRLLADITQSKQTLEEAYLGVMRSAYIIDKHGETKIFANKIIDYEQAQPQDTVEAHFYLGKVALEQNNLDEAFDQFQITADATKSEMGIEARYHIADIYFRQKKYSLAEDLSYTIIEDLPSSNYWIAKSFILLADISIEGFDDAIQAEAMLQSVIQNYQRDDLKKIAQQKLEQLKEKQEQKDNIIDFGESPNDSMIIEGDGTMNESSENETPDSLNNDPK